MHKPTDVYFVVVCRDCMPVVMLSKWQNAHDMISWKSCVRNIFFFAMLKILHHYFLSAFSSILGKHDMFQLNLLQVM